MHFRFARAVVVAVLPLVAACAGSVQIVTDGGSPSDAGGTADDAADAAPDSNAPVTCVSVGGSCVAVAHSSCLLPKRIGDPSRVA